LLRNYELRESEAAYLAKLALGLDAATQKGNIIVQSFER